MNGDGGSSSSSGGGVSGGIDDGELDWTTANTHVRNTLYLPLSKISIVCRDSFSLIIKMLFSAHAIYFICVIECSLFSRFHFYALAIYIVQWKKAERNTLTKIPSTNPFWVVGPKSRI